MLLSSSVRYFRLIVAQLSRKLQLVSQLVISEIIKILYIFANSIACLNVRRGIGGLGGESPLRLCANCQTLYRLDI